VGGHLFGKVLAAGLRRHKPLGGRGSTDVLCVRSGAMLSVSELSGLAVRRVRARGCKMRAGSAVGGKQPGLQGVGECRIQPHGAGGVCLQEEVAAGSVYGVHERKAVDAGDALWAGGIQALAGAGVQDVEAVRAVHRRGSEAAFAGQGTGERALLATEEFAKGSLCRAGKASAVRAGLARAGPEGGAVLAGRKAEGVGEQAVVVAQQAPRQRD
ncbi:unnamed protein product, partial [Symbiodinium sp. CCMP2456]